MPINVLSPDQLSRRRGRGSARSDYVDILADLEPGYGGEVNVTEEGVSRQTVKNRINRAAEMLGKPIAFVRSDTDSVVFEVLASHRTRRQRRARSAD